MHLTASEQVGFPNMGLTRSKEWEDVANRVYNLFAPLPSLGKDYACLFVII